MRLEFCFSEKISSLKKQMSTNIVYVVVVVAVVVVVVVSKAASRGELKVILAWSWQRTSLRCDRILFGNRMKNFQLPILHHLQKNQK